MPHSPPARPTPLDAVLQQQPRAVREDVYQFGREVRVRRVAAHVQHHRRVPCTAGAGGGGEGPGTPHTKAPHEGGWGMGPPLQELTDGAGGGGGGHEAMVLVGLPLAAPIGLLPLHILTPCGSERGLGGGGGGQTFLRYTPMPQVLSRN